MKIIVIIFVSKCVFSRGSKMWILGVVLHAIAIQSQFCFCRADYGLGESRLRFKKCLEHCVHTGCVEALTAELTVQNTDCRLAQACTNFTHKPIPWSLSWTGWSCEVRASPLFFHGLGKAYSMDACMEACI